MTANTRANRAAQRRRHALHTGDAGEETDR
jgi:hypothetical protein